MKDRFDLEQQILDCWRIVDDLKLLSEYVIEDPSSTKDSISNVTIGLEQLYQIKFDKLFRTFEELVRNKTIGNNPLNDGDVT